MQKVEGSNPFSRLTNPLAESSALDGPLALPVAIRYDAPPASFAGALGHTGVTTARGERSFAPLSRSAQIHDVRTIGRLRAAPALLGDSRRSP
jgi:hypothetical protein